MNEMVQAFLKERQAEQQEEYEIFKRKKLIELGLFEKVYYTVGENKEDYPCSEWDGNSSYRLYKQVPIDVTDEEFEEIMKYCHKDTTQQGKNIVSLLFLIIAVLVYVVGFVGSFSLGMNEYGELTAMVFVYMVLTFIIGTTYLGFSKVIELLESIKNK